MGRNKRPLSPFFLVSPLSLSRRAFPFRCLRSFLTEFCRAELQLGHDPHGGPSVAGGNDPQGDGRPCVEFIVKNGEHYHHVGHDPHGGPLTVPVAGGSDPHGTGNPCVEFVKPSRDLLWFIAFHLVCVYRIVRDRFRRGFQLLVGCGGGEGVAIYVDLSSRVPSYVT